jgi:hypothetical protein
MASQWSIIVDNYQQRFTKALRQFDLAATFAMFTVAFALGIVVLTWSREVIIFKPFWQCDEQCQRFKRLEAANVVIKQISECEFLLKAGALREAMTKCAGLKARVDALRPENQQGQR